MKHPDLTLIEQLLAGDRLACAQAVNRLGPVIQSRVRLFLRTRSQKSLNSLQIEDLVHQVWCRLLTNDGRRLRNFNPEQRSLEGYVNMIAYQELIDLLRKGNHALPSVGLDDAPEIEDEAPSVDRRVQSSQEAQLLREHLMQELPEKGQIILKLRYDDGLSDADVASTLGVQKQVVYNWTHRIRKIAKAWSEKNSTEHT